MAELEINHVAYLNPPGWHKPQPKTEWTLGDKVISQLEDIPKKAKELAKAVLRRGKENPKRKP